MTKNRLFPAVALGALALAACGDSGAGGSGRDYVRAVGSSTVYPFAKEIATTFTQSNPGFESPIIESIGSGRGIGDFCNGVGYEHPDIANASRRMKLSEFEDCQANNVTDVVEIQVGMDGIAFASAQGGINMALTQELVYRALAARPYGEEQTAQTWADVDSSLPDIPILVYGPPSTSGTRDALEELILEAGCEANPAMAAIEEADEDEYDRICTEIRSDGLFVDQGEQDNLIVQKIESNSQAVGVFGYSYLEENSDKVQGLTMNGVEPTYANISSFAYPGARPLYIYVKKEHLDTIPGLREFVAEWTLNWGRGGLLASKGLVVNPDDVMARSTTAATEFTTLTAADFE